MHRFLFIVLTTLMFASLAVAQNITAEALVRDAQVSMRLGDFYSAYRVLTFLKGRQKNTFYRDAGVEYLQVLSAIGSENKLAQECNSLKSTKGSEVKSKLMLECGKMFFELFNLKKSQEYLETISLRSNSYPEASVYLSSVYMSNSDGEKCLKLLDEKLLKRMKSQEVKDLYYLTRARCHIEINQTDKAILDYQQISTTSVFYSEALEETIWAQFKSRRLESSRTLLDVLITTYESRLSTGQNVGPASYYRGRYLQAYIELVEKNGQRAENLFRSLNSAIEKYAKEQERIINKSNDYSRQIATESQNWIDVRAMPAEIKEFLFLVKEWGDPRQKHNLDRVIDRHISYVRELQKLKTNPSPDFAQYREEIAKLEQQNRIFMAQEFERASRSVNRAFSVMKIKSELGRIEIIWSQRAQGVRSIGELLEAYQQEVNDVEDYFSL